MRELHRPDETFGKLIPAQAPRPGIFYVPSRFSLPFSHRGKAYIFNTLTKQCVEAELPESTTAGAGYDDLIKARFLVPGGMDEYGFFRSVITLLQLNNRKHLKPAYTILPTLGCNARCVYCIQEGLKPVGMNAETVEDTLRFILSDCGGKEITLNWFGGEPLLREDVIDRLSRGLKEAGVEYKSLMISNGSLITPATIEKMVDLWHVQSIQISMDGAERDYIARKRYLTYRDDYHTVIDAISRMSDTDISVSVRCNVDENNLPRIPHFLEDLSIKIENKKNVNMYLSPIYQKLREKGSIQLLRDILAMENRIEAAGFAVTLKRIGFTLSGYHCLSDTGGIVIMPDGKLLCCEELADGSVIGTVREGITDPDARKAFARIQPVPGKCEDCKFLPTCMPFPTCPKFGLLCREGYTLLTLDALKKMIDNEMKGKESLA